MKLPDTPEGVASTSRTVAAHKAVEDGVTGILFTDVTAASDETASPGAIVGLNAASAGGDGIGSTIRRSRPWCAGMSPRRLTPAPGPETPALSSEMPPAGH
jgi:hypothetical protein